MLPIPAYESLRQLPEGRAVMYQNWRDLLFLHFACNPLEIQTLIPEGLEVDTFEDRAWVGLVPFRMEGIRPVGVPAVAGLSAFPETNVRTYVHREGKPGVWFFSLDAGNAIACSIARRFFGLPYFHAKMSVHQKDDLIEYVSQRTSERTQCVVKAKVDYEALMVEPGSLEFFLVERYLLYSLHHGRLNEGRVFHKPYPLVKARAEFVEENLVQSAGIHPQDFDHVVFSPGVDVRVFGLSEVCS